MKMKLGKLKGKLNLKGMLKLSKKKVILIIVVVIAIFGVTKLFGGKKETGVPVVTTPLEKGDIQETIVLKAPLEGSESVEVVSSLHQEVRQIYVKEGDTVTKGQILATLDSENIQEDIKTAQDQLSLLQYQSKEGEAGNNNAYDLAKAQLDSKLEQGQRDYEKAMDAMNEAKRQMDNTTLLVQAGASPQEELTKMTLAYQEAERIVQGYNVSGGKVVASKEDLKNLENTKINIGKASTKKSIEIARTELQKKQKGLKDCEIKSTIDGTVTRVYSKVGRFADDTEDKKPMFVIENLKTLQVKGTVNENDVWKIKVGQTVTVSTESLKGKTVQGMVSRISPTGEEKTGTTQRVIPVVVDVKKSDMNLIAGTTAKAEILIAEAKDAFLVPAEALYQKEDGTMSIFSVDGKGKVKEIAVTTGIENNINIQVMGEDLKKGDSIIMSPDASIQDGMQVMNTNGSAAPEGAAVAEG